MISMTNRMLIFGMGYVGSRIAHALEADSWNVVGIGRNTQQDVPAAIASATHILSTVAPEGDVDPILAAYGDALKGCGAQWIGYISSTGVYGDTGGAWVDESAPIGSGRRGARVAADLEWQALGAHVFRLPGIYGPGRSALDRVRAGRAHRIDLPQQVFSRIHVDDIVSAIRASFGRSAGVFNISDDRPASQNAVIEHACALLGMAPPPLQLLDEAGLTPAASAFYAENRRISNAKAKRLLGWAPQYYDYKQGLDAIFRQIGEKGD